jgi:drug/metabolite transporter (DMT)-like permease
MTINEKYLKWWLFAAISLIWGSSFILMKGGMTALSAYQVAALRMVSGCLTLLPIAIRNFRQIPQNKLAPILITGVVGSFVPAFLFCVAETRIDSSLAGILNALTPLFTIIIGWMVFRVKVGTQKITGVLIGFAGLCLLFFTRGQIDLKEISYASLVLLATICYAVNVHLVSRYLKGIDAINIAAIAFAFLLLPSIFILWYTGYFSLPLSSAPLLKATTASLVLGVMGTAVATILFYRLIKLSGTLFASLVTYGIPFVAIAWGLFFGETIGLLQVGCLGIILGGVYLVTNSSE